MESPYYEMTHDFEEENRLFQSGYVKGYHDAVMKYPAIVRCKNCRFWQSRVSRVIDGKECNLCEMVKGYKPADWFCADGKCKEGR